MTTEEAWETEWETWTSYPMPADLEECLKSQLDDFRERFNDEPVKPQTRRRVPVSLFCLAVAGVILWALVVANQNSHQSNAVYAQSIERLKEQSWVRTVTKTESGSWESWYSAERAISVAKYGKQVHFYDHQAGMIYSYNPDSNRIFKSPEFRGGSKDHYAQFVRNYQLLEKTLRMPEQDLAIWKEITLPLVHGDGEVISCREEGAGAESSILRSFKVKLRSPDRSTSFKVVVDPERKLPVELQAEGYSVEFSYPKDGPSSIHDLVRKDASLVDLTPDSRLVEIERIIQRSRREMDSYRAVVVEKHPTQDFAHWNQRPILVSRKGGRFRSGTMLPKILDTELEYPRPRQLDLVWLANLGTLVNIPEEIVVPSLPTISLPVGEDTERRWWFQRLDDWSVDRPLYITGSSSYSRVSTKALIENGELTASRVTEVQTFEAPMTSDGDVIPPYYSRRPEFVCRLTFSLGNPSYRFTISQEVEDGPAGCILVTAEPLPDSPLGDPTLERVRFWLNPDRDYIAEKWQVGGSTTTIESVAQSPSGVWYVTDFRTSSIAPDGRLVESQFKIFVDFETVLPDSYFSTPKVGDVIRFD